MPPLPRKHHFCIWCGHALWDVKHPPEHILPKSLRGRLYSSDVCGACNHRFGGESDWKLLHDQRVFEAAVGAGIPAEEFLGTYDGVTFTNGGNEVRLRVVGGVSRVIKGLGATPVHIGSDQQGHFCPKDVEALRAMKRSQAKKRLPHIDPTLVESEVDRIVDSVFNERPGASSYSPLLGEGFAIDVTSHQVNVSRTFNELETYEAVAKILFTLARSVLPCSMERPMAEVLAHVKRFALAETHDPNPIHFEQLTRPAARRHRLAVRLGRDGFCFEVILFDILRWWIQGNGVNRSGGAVGMPAYVWEAVDDRFAPDVTVQESCN